MSLTIPWADDMPWAADALCAQIGGNDWFPNDSDKAAAARARAVCHECPVIAECAAYAIPQPGLEGIWGALSVNERRALRNPQPEAPRQTGHGTTTGYRAHYKHGEKPCEPCRVAFRTRANEHAARRSAAKRTVDPTNVKRAIDGEPVELNENERTEVVRRLAALGYPDSKVAKHIGRSLRQVTRIRAKHNIESRWVAA